MYTIKILGCLTTVFSGDYYDFGGFDYPVKELLTRNDKERAANYWLTPNGQDGEFILKLCKQKTVLSISLVNTHNANYRDRSSKEFKVYLGDQSSGPWTQVLHDTLEDSRQQKDPLPILDFPITPTKARFVKFELLSFYGNFGGGLQYFTIRGIKHKRF